jgi:Ras-related protein Rab-1A
MTNKFISDTKTTIGVDLQVKTLKVNGVNTKLQIWDFGGEERFRFFLPRYIKGAHGGVLMYDITNSASISHIDDWLLVIKESNEFLPILLVGGKSDLDTAREVAFGEGKNLAESRDLAAFIECSSKTGQNVELLFEILCKKMMEGKKSSWI